MTERTMASGTSFEGTWVPRKLYDNHEVLLESERELG